MISSNSNQLSIFGYAGQSAGLPPELVDYRPGLFSPEESEYLKNVLIAETTWTQPVVKMYDKEMLTPRLIAWYGDPDLQSARNPVAHITPWTKELLFIRERVQSVSGIACNSVLLNYYRDGNDSVAWHSDKESLSGVKNVVASVSFGEVRSFDIRSKQNHAERYSIRLENGSFLLMKAGFQDHWEHRIAKSTKTLKARLNLTFRLIG